MAETPLFPKGSPDGEPLLFPASPVRPRSRADDDPAPVRDRTRRVVVDGVSDPSVAPDPQLPKAAQPPARRAPSWKKAPTPAAVSSPSATGGGLTGSVTLIGTINGSVSVDAGHRRFLGPAALVIAGVSMAVVLVVGLVSDPSGITNLLICLAIPFFPLLVFGMIPKMALGGSIKGAAQSSAQKIGSAASSATRKAAQGMVSAAKKGMRTSRTPHAFTERRFRIQLLTGEFVTCLLSGELVGDDVRHGDIVMVRGRRVRGGSYRVRWINVLSSPAGPVIRRVTAKLPGAFRFKRVVNGLCFLLAGLVLLLSLLAGIEALQ